jgi:signal transduction histidine kinase/CheY-like chemotaxis protein
MTNGPTLLQRVIYAGTKPNNNDFENDRIQNFNRALFAGIAFVLVNTIYVYFADLPYTVLIDVVYCIALLIAYFINRAGAYTFATGFAFVITNIFLLAASYVEGRFAGNYLLFIPITVVLALIIRLKQNIAQVIFFILVMAACLALSLTICPAKSVLQPVDDSMYFSMYITNICTAIAISTVFSIVLYRINGKNEKRLIEEKEYVNLLFNTSMEGVFLLNSKTNVIEDCNQRALDMFECDNKSTFVNMGIMDAKKIFLNQLYHNGTPVDFHSILEKDAWQGEAAYYTRTGKEFYCAINFISFTYNNKQYKKASITDITVLKNTEQQLRTAIQKAEENAFAKSRFLSNMSHELRTPLNGIIGTTNLALAESVSGSVKEYLDVLKFSSEHMLNLVNDVLDYSRLEDGKMETEKNTFNLKKTVEKLQPVFAPQFKEKGIELIIDIDESLSTVINSDATKLLQVINNLLSNGLKFTRKGGVTLSIKANKITSNSLSATFEVQDTGIGISPAMQAQVFERFTQADVNTTRRFGGSGLGLTISKMLVELLGGKLQLESELHKGSKFYFTLELPRKEKNIELPQQTNIPPATEALKNKRVLIAEDNPVNMMIAKRFLAKWGAHITEAANGVEAVALFQQQPFDIALLDIEMPEMDGSTALYEIRKINNAIPAIAFTAAVYDNMQEDFEQKGFTAFLHKPFKPEELLELIQRHA